MSLNIQSFLLLALVLLSAAFALRYYIRKYRRTGGCGSCNCQCALNQNVQLQKTDKSSSQTVCCEKHPNSKR